MSASETTPATPAAHPAKPGGGPVETLGLAACIEAILMSAERPVPPSRLAASLLGRPSEGDDEPARANSADAKRIEQAITELNRSYEHTGRTFRIESVPGGYRVMTLPAFAPALEAMAALKPPAKLSRPAIETLAIIAYRQPVGRAQLEAIRGVACGEVLKSLIERRLVTVVGRAEELGRPMLYGTTRQFLEAFGLASLADLPQEGELTQAG